MATAESVKTKIQGLLATANEATGNSDTDLTTAVNALVAGFGTGEGDGGVKVTEYILTEDADRSLWINEQGIKLVKGLNYLMIGAITGATSETVVNNRSGLTVSILMLWDGVAITNSPQNSVALESHLRGWYAASNGYNTVLGAGHGSLISGLTKQVTVAEDGLITFTTTATGVTTGNYANSFIGAGNTYYLFQAESEVLC